jgi:hypothetical protein
MGGSSSKISDKSYLSKSDTEIVSLMMPVYFTAEEVTAEDVVLATNSWKLIGLIHNTIIILLPLLPLLLLLLLLPFS